MVCIWSEETAGLFATCRGLRRCADGAVPHSGMLLHTAGEAICGFRALDKNLEGPVRVVVSLDKKTSGMRPGVPTRRMRSVGRQRRRVTRRLDVSAVINSGLCTTPPRGMHGERLPAPTFLSMDPDEPSTQRPRKKKVRRTIVLTNSDVTCTSCERLVSTVGPGCAWTKLSCHCVTSQSLCVPKADVPGEKIATTAPSKPESPTEPLPSLFDASSDDSALTLPETPWDSLFAGFAESHTAAGN